MHKAGRFSPRHRAWQLTPAVPARGRWRKEDQESKVILGEIAEFCKKGGGAEKEEKEREKSQRMVLSGAWP